MINIEGLENLPLSKGRGIKKIGLIHPVSHSEESGIFTGRGENLIHSLCHSEERIVRRENPIIFSSTVPNIKKD